MWDWPWWDEPELEWRVWTDDWCSEWAWCGSGGSGCDRDIPGAAVVVVPLEDDLWILEKEKREEDGWRGRAGCEACTEAEESVVAVDPDDREDEASEEADDELVVESVRGGGRT